MRKAKDRYVENGD